MVLDLNLSACLSITQRGSGREEREAVTERGGGRGREGDRGRQREGWRRRERGRKRGRGKGEEGEGGGEGGGVGGGRGGGGGGGRCMRREEERRVGKESRCRWSPDHEQKRRRPCIM